jgi:hypothetical protein
LRSKGAELVRQELFGLMMLHFAVRGLMQSGVAGRPGSRRTVVPARDPTRSTQTADLRRHFPLGTGLRCIKRRSMKSCKSASRPASIGETNALWRRNKFLGSVKVEEISANLGLKKISPRFAADVSLSA